MKKKNLLLILLIIIVIIILIFIIKKNKSAKNDKTYTIDDCFGNYAISLYSSDNHNKLIANINIKKNENIYELFALDNIDGIEAGQHLKILGEWDFSVKSEQDSIKSIERYSKFAKNTNVYSLDFDMQTTYKDFTIFRYSEYSEHTISIYYNLHNGYYLHIFCQMDESDSNYSTNEYINCNENKIKFLCDLIKKHVNSLT